MRTETEDLLEATPALERAAAIKQDELESREKAKRIDMQQRPQIKFSTFSGRPEDFDIFLKNTERLFHLYPGAEQRVLQMAELVTADIKPHILRYLDAGESGPAQAIQAMKSRYGMKKLIRPDLLARLKNMKTASSMTDIPATAEKILTILPGHRGVRLHR